MQVRAQQNDTLDLLCHRHLGATAGVVEATLKLNPGLSEHGAVLPHGLLVQLPTVQAAATKAADVIQLWD